MRTAVMVVGLVAGCRGGSGTTPFDAPVDPTDAPQPRGTFYTACRPDGVTTLAFPDIPIGQTGTYVVTYWPGVDPNRNPPGHSLMGEGFTLTELGVGLPPIQLEIAFRPTRLGPYRGVLTGRGVEVMIEGTGIAALPSSPLVVERYFDNSERPIRIENRSTSTPLELLSTTADPEIYVEEIWSPGCPTTLQPGDACNVSLRTATQIGCRRTTTTIRAAGETAPITVESFGSAAGVHPALTYTSDPPNGCDSARCVASRVTLTPVPPPDQVFVGWPVDMGCDQGPTCEFWPGGPALLRFAPASRPRVAITLSGSATGKVIMHDANDVGVACDRGTCTFGTTSSEVRLIATSPSQFVGWTGACAGTNPQCNLGALSGNVTVGATFTSDPAEVAVLGGPQFEASPSQAPRSGGFLPGGDIVLTGDQRIARMTLGGATVWSRDARPIALAVSPSGSIYYTALSGSSVMVVKLDDAGNRVWARTLSRRRGSGFCGDLALASTGDVAVLADEQLITITATDGSELWRRPAPGCERVAASATGPIAVVVVDVGTGAYSIARYSLTGVRLADFPLAGAASDMAYDAQGHLVVSNATQLTRLAPDGSIDFAIARPLAAEHVAVASSGDIIIAGPHSAMDGGLRLARYSPGGVLLASFDRPGFSNASASAIGLVATGLAPGPAGRLLVIGVHRLGGANRPWATVFDASF